MDCRNIAEATKMATSLYKEAIHVPFMAKYDILKICFLVLNGVFLSGSVCLPRDMSCLRPV